MAWEDLPPEHREWIIENKTLLAELPGELCPGPKHGKFSWTVWGKSGARMEVLIKAKAFYVKSPGEGAPETAPLGRVRWDRNGSARSTWALLRQEILWEGTAW